MNGMSLTVAVHSANAKGTLHFSFKIRRMFLLFIKHKIITPFSIDMKSTTRTHKVDVVYKYRQIM